jgi:hypothetical protein
MMLRVFATVLALAAPLAANAQTTGGPLPRAFAGYSQPAITASMCKVVNPAQTQCLVPAMTAGRYLIEAAGTSTAQDGKARQALEIAVGDTVCGLASPANPAPWSSGARTFRVDCEVTLLTDAPVVVRVIYTDAHAVKDPVGPTLSMRPLSWQGVLGARMFPPQPPKTSESR